MLVGPFIGGGLAEAFSLQTPFLFAGAVIIGAMAVEYGIGKRAVGAGARVKSVSPNDRLEQLMK